MQVVFLELKLVGQSLTYAVNKTICVAAVAAAVETHMLSSSAIFLYIFSMYK